jgi:hypothetical protein
MDSKKRIKKDTPPKAGFVALLQRIIWSSLFLIPKFEAN